MWECVGYESGICEGVRDGDIHMVRYYYSSGEKDVIHMACDSHITLS